MSPKHRALLLVVATLVAAVGGAPADARSPGDVFADCANCPEMVVVPGGTFRMGDDTGPPDERPVHEVTIASFAVARTEVTRAQYAAFAGETGRGALGTVPDGHRSRRALAVRKPTRTGPIRAFRPAMPIRSLA